MTNPTPKDEILLALETPSTKPYPGERKKRRAEAKAKLTALITAAREQLLNELEDNHVVYHYQRGVGEGFFKAVPLEKLDDFRATLTNDKIEGEHGDSK